MPTNFIKELSARRQLQHQHDSCFATMRSKIFNYVLILQEFVDADFLANIIERYFISFNYFDGDVLGRVLDMYSQLDSSIRVRRAQKKKSLETA